MFSFNKDTIKNKRVLFSLIIFIIFINNTYVFAETNTYEIYKNNPRLLLYDFLLTIFSYMIVPTTIRIANKKGFSKNKAEKIALINSVIVWLIYMIIKSNLGITQNSGAAFLYYWINKVILTNKDIKDEDENVTLNDLKTSNKKPNINEKNNYNDVNRAWQNYLKSTFPNNGTKTNFNDLRIKETKVGTNEESKLSFNDSELTDFEFDTNNKRKHYKDDSKKYVSINVLAIILVFSIIIITSLVIYIILNKNNETNNDGITANEIIQNLNEQNSKLSNEKLDLEIENIGLKEKAKFLDNNIVFVIDGYGNYYYTYDQMEEVTRDKGEYYYTAYNIEGAKSLGYKAWK